MRVSVLGSGRWGSFLAWYSSGIGHEVMLWGRVGSRTFRDLASTRRNNYLALQPEIEFTTELSAAVSSANVILVAISAQHLRALSRDIAHTDYHHKVFSLNMKGLESSTGKRLSEVMREELNNGDKIAVWVGPGHVQDLVDGVVCVEVSDEQPDHKQEMRRVFPDGGHAHYDLFAVGGSSPCLKATVDEKGLIAVPTRASSVPVQQAATCHTRPDWWRKSCPVARVWTKY